MVDDKKWTLHRALVDRVLHGEGRASPEQRSAAFNNAGLPEPLQALVDKVAAMSWKATDADVAAAKTAGSSEDEIFELVINAAVGQSTRQYEAALAALADAIGTGESG